MQPAPYHKNSPQSVWNKFNSSPGKKILLDSILQDVTWMHQDCSSSHWESWELQLWKQLWILRVKGQPTISAGLGSQLKDLPGAAVSQEIGEHCYVCKKPCHSSSCRWNYHCQFKSLSLGLQNHTQTFFIN